MMKLRLRWITVLIYLFLSSVRLSLHTTKAGLQVNYLIHHLSLPWTMGRNILSSQ
uniref:Protein PIR n=1 Tax=Rhizophora mucronata TaxID=61149 RepID=A0A2P2KU83_RHIMU